MPVVGCRSCSPRPDGNTGPVLRSQSEPTTANSARVIDYSNRLIVGALVGTTPTMAVGTALGSEARKPLRCLRQDIPVAVLDGDEDIGRAAILGILFARHDLAPRACSPLA